MDQNHEAAWVQKGADHGIPTMDRKENAGPRRVKAVEARVQIDVRLEAARRREQTDLQVGMPEDCLVPPYQ